jgi:hypothetical protein
VGLVAVARRLPHGLGTALGLIAVAGLLPSEVAWGWQKTPPLFTGDPKVRIESRREAAAWLARTSRRDDVLFGYDPLFLAAWERSDRVSRTVVPRADATLALRVLRARRQPLGRGVWVFDRSDNNNVLRRLYIPLRTPEPTSAFEVRAYGPFLVIRTRKPTLTPRRYLEASRLAMLVGKDLYIGDADVNYDTVTKALRKLESSR